MKKITNHKLKLQPNKKSKLFNPFNNDEDWDIVDKNLPIKEKSKNPFWVPQKNSEIFEVREVLKQEKEKKRFITRAKRQKESNKDYTSIRQDGQSSLYLTEQRFLPDISKKKAKINRDTSIKEENVSDYLETMSNMGNGNVNTLGTKILEKIKEKKEKENNDDSEKIQSEKLQEKIDMMNNKKKDNVRDYIKKTRDIILTKYRTEIKKERAIRMGETYQNEIESIKDSIMTMKEMKKLFEDEFFQRFESYVRHLRNQKEREKNELNNLLDDRNHLDIDVVKLENRIQKEKEKLIKYTEYRDFLICIKERRIQLPDFFTSKFKEASSLNIGVTFDANLSPGNPNNTNNPSNNLINSNDNLNTNENNDIYKTTLNNNNENSSKEKDNKNAEKENTTKNISSILKIDKLEDSNKKRLKSIYRSPTKSKKSSNNISNSNAKESQKSEIERYRNYLIKPIFESAEELNDEIKKMEIENINLLEKLNTNRANINLLKQEYEKDKESENKMEEYVKKDIAETEKYFFDLKEKNAKLLDEKNYLSNEKIFSQTNTQINPVKAANKTVKNFYNAMSKTVRNKNVKNAIISFTRQKYGQSILYGKVNNIFQGCLELDINKKTGGDKENNILFMLKTVEKSLDFLLSRQRYYYSDPVNAQEWEKKKNELDKKRKIRKAEENKYLEENKREQLKLNIHERNNRVLVIPKKKYGEKFRPVEKSKDKKNTKKNETDADLLF